MLLEHQNLSVELCYHIHKRKMIVDLYSVGKKCGTLRIHLFYDALALIFYSCVPDQSSFLTREVPRPSSIGNTKIPAVDAIYTQ